MSNEKWDAALNHPNDSNKVYFFKGDQYERYNIINNKKDNGYPLPMGGDDYWPGIPINIDAVINHPEDSNKVYFFKKDEYWRYDFKKGAVDDGYPLPMGSDDYWPGIPTDIDTALNSPIDSNKVYFFKKDKYWRYDFKKNAVDDDYPLPMGGKYWPDIPSDIEFAYRDPNYPGKNIIFIQNGKYFLYDMGKTTVIDGYPKSVSEILKDGFECPGCKRTGGGASDEWGVRGHFSYVADDEETCHLLNIIINCIDAAPQGAEIRVATCIWKDDLKRSEVIDDCQVRKQGQKVDGQDVFCALQRAFKRGCKISITKIADQPDSEYHSSTMNKKLHQWDKNCAGKVNYHWAGPCWNHFKGVMISSMTVNSNVAKYLGLEAESDNPIYDVTIITSTNLSNIDAKKYQDMTLSWNWKENKEEETPAGFIYDTSVDFFNKLITKNGPKDNKDVLTSEHSTGAGAGVLLYPRILEGHNKNDDTSYAKSDPVVQFLEKFERITSIKIAMAYWQGHNVKS